MEIKILKEQEEGIHTSIIYRILIVTMPSTLVLALHDRGNVFVIGVDISGIRIGITLMQDGIVICTEVGERLSRARGSSRSPSIEASGASKASTSLFEEDPQPLASLDFVGVL
ncbi:hypothetical protein BHM03_00058628 [Ensete ventricosum]|nr:hypothetical protein BHM03_00058628 [Ensete ventricosum]